MVPIFIWSFTTIFFWLLGRQVYQRWPRPVANPVFLGVVALILLLLVLHISPDEYAKGGRLLSDLLDPAVVAFAVPLYRQRKNIAKNWRPIFGAVFVGSFTGIISASGLAFLLSSSRELAWTMASKSVTTAIAVKLSEEVGGIGSLTAAIVIVSGILGAMIGPAMLAQFKISDRMAVGLAVGTAAHGIGTARMVEEDRGTGGEVFAAMAITGMILNGFVTSLFISIFNAVFGVLNYPRDLGFQFPGH